MSDIARSPGVSAAGLPFQEFVYFYSIDFVRRSSAATFGSNLQNAFNGKSRKAAYQCKHGGFGTGEALERSSRGHEGILDLLEAIQARGGARGWKCR